MNTKNLNQALYRILAMCAVLLLTLATFGSALAQVSAIYVVTATDEIDDGACTRSHCNLREAINLGNAHPGSDRIEFKLHGSPPFTIQPLAALPEISDPLTIDGTTQPGFHDNAGHRAGWGECWR